VLYIRILLVIAKISLGKEDVIETVIVIGMISIKSVFPYNQDVNVMTFAVNQDVI
jgi:hypothetical protein